MTTTPKIHRPTATTLIALAALAVIAAGCGKTAERKDAAPVADTIQTAAATAATDTVSGTFTDPRDGKTYRTVRIGTQTWMAENLNFVTDSSVCYDNDDSNCQKYGRLYDWDAAMKACPTGWRLPAHEDWAGLVKTVGGNEIAGKKLKSKNGWDGTDELGFSAMPGGYCFIAYPDNNVQFCGIGKLGFWWSATGSAIGKEAHFRVMYSYYEYMGGNYFDRRRNMFSVRCVQNSGDTGVYVTPQKKLAHNGFINDIDSILAAIRTGDCRDADDYPCVTHSDESMLLLHRVLLPDTLSHISGIKYSGSRTLANIQRGVARNMARTSVSDLRRNSGLRGKIVINFAVNEFGNVTSVQVIESTILSFEAESISAELADIVRRWKFGKIDSPGDVTDVTYPLVFSQ